MPSQQTRNRTLNALTVLYVLQSLCSDQCWPVADICESSQLPFQASKGAGLLSTEAARHEVCTPCLMLALSLFGQKQSFDDVSFASLPRPCMGRNCCFLAGVVVQKLPEAQP